MAAKTRKEKAEAFVALLPIARRLDERGAHLADNAD
jgi:hypothetical protein